jgi:uncharacterized protein
MLNLTVLLEHILASYQLPLSGTHDILHWGRVFESGRRLSPATGAVGQVVDFFSILHDSQRRSEGGDRDYGPRAAAYARTLRSEIDLCDRDFELLIEACDCHTRGTTSGADITVQTCLDADRLDIPRVGLRINTRLLHTPAAKNPSILWWASMRAARRVVPEVVVSEWGMRMLPAEGHS